MSYDLAWGDPIIVREALSETLGRDVSLFAYTLQQMGYTPHFGDETLIKQLKDLATAQSGRKFKHLFVTCGASGAVNAALYALKTNRTDWVSTDDRYYPMYPAIIDMADMIMVNRRKKEDLIREGCGEHNFVSLSASPSNPDGLVCPFESIDIWDAAYASRVYTRGCSHVPQKYRIMCGSLGKSLGLAGLRLGWVCTDEDLLADFLKKYILASYVGLSDASMGIAKEILSKLDRKKFETVASGYIDDNRYEFQKVSDKFGQGSIPSRGMFATLELGKVEKKALEKANIKWQPGNTWGEDEKWARFSLGQNRELIRKAVRAVLK